ncbi:MULTISPECIES: AAA family ATPase [unclassified Bradyrhizobium]|uniref:AAA family ATPase n=1 Tax=unclassified Bradyrhizobium TaxID=2631580 RepID=UPI002FF31339
MVTIAGYEIRAPVHRSHVRSIYSAVRVADHLPVIIKTLNAEYPSKHDVARLQRDFQITQRLQSIEGVIRVYALETYGNGNIALVLEPFGHSLAEEIAARKERFPLDGFFKIAMSLAETLAGVHELDVVHKNIEPHSVLVDAAGTLRLIDFGISSELALERQQYALPKRREGNLPYMSPEQTGRMNRELDYRSDYYSLGVTLFELLTGRLPFQADSVLEWVHSHISKSPPSPSEIDPTIPEAVSAIVLKLMAKNAEERYQSSYGLLSDLGRCQRELANTGVLPMFALGQHDVSRKFQIPQKLYGREPEIAVLLALFERVAAGGTEFCMVSGYPGVGKSALVNEISKPLVGRQGYLIQGKFDQFQRSTPYSAIAFAFRDLVQQLLAESNERQQEWRQKLLASLTPNAQLLIDLIPDLELIIGPQPPVPELPRTEDQNRFQITFLNFVKVIANEQALVIFLDDLQFGDISTLNVIRWLGTARDLTHLLVIGAFRSNEIDMGHPLRIALNELQETRSIHELPLQPLDLVAVDQLVAETLRSDIASCQALSKLLYERTLGNAFFLTETLKALERERAIAFAPERGRWCWDMEAVRRSGLASNVIELMVVNLRRLPPATQRVLQLAACIGNTFDLRTLAIIYESSIGVASEHLLPALRQHVIVPLQEDYKLVGEAPTTTDHMGLTDGANPTYRFQHDHVQQAAYALIDQEHKQSVHLRVGRLMQRHESPQEREQRLIDIVGHLNEGRRLIDDPVERNELARLNLAAGIRSQRASAYETALSYLCIGLELLPADRWATEYNLTMALATEYQQCAYLTKRYDEAEAWIEQLLMQARTNLEKAELLSMRTRQYSTTGKMEASIQAAITGLSLLGVRITKSPDRAAIRRERMRVKRNLAGRRIADLINAPALSDPAKMVSIRLLMEIFPAAFLSGSGELFPFLVLKSVNISLRYGNSPESAFAYAGYGMLLCGALEDPAQGYEFGKLAVAMNDRFDDIALKSRVIYVYAMFIHHWSNHWSSMTPWFRRGIESGYQSGDLLYLAYSAQDCIIWDPKLDLETAVKEHANYMSVVRDCAYQDSFDSGSLFLQMQRNFLGWTNDLCSMSDADFDEKRCVEGMLQRQFMTGVANYHIYKAEICFLYGNYAEALSHVREQDKLIASAMSLPQLVRFYFVAFLTLAVCLPAMKSVEKTQTLKRMKADLRRMTRWANHCPANFLHLQLLMEAELTRLDGRVEPALRLYERAMDAARASAFHRDEAMANELAARHLLAAQRPKAAEGYLRAARHLYERWGAQRKIEHMDEEFAQLLTPQAARSSVEVSATTAAGFDSASLDMASVIKASQAISSEIVLERLWATTMRVMLENAGGQRGCFVVRKGGQFVMEGLSEVGGDVAEAAGSIPIDGAAGALSLPISIVYHVLHTNSPVIVHDVARAGRFAKDAYLLARKARSLLCIPLMRQGKLEGAIYMENRLAAGAFTEERIEVIKLLAAQVFISIENAKLYADQQRLIEAQRRFVPSEFLESLHRPDIARVEAGEYVAKTMSILFADLRNFTPLAERLDPRAVIELLNGYFLSMEPEISQVGGFIDSFDGDRIKALFDAPADAPVRAGVGMWRALDQLNRRSVYLSQPQLHMGIGLNTGFMVLGVIGGRNRMQCSFIGDTANLAARIEQLTKVYRARLLISEHTLQGLKDPNAFAIRMVDRVSVKGKNEGVDIYEVLDAETPERRAIKLKTVELLRSGMEKYFCRDFNAARIAFERARSESPEDVLPTLFLERCARYRQQPPPDNWDGIERLGQQ